MNKTGVSRGGVLTRLTVSLVENLQKLKAANVSDKVFDIDSIGVYTRRMNRFLIKFGHTTHDFRHSRITELIEGGMKVKAV